MGGLFFSPPTSISLFVRAPSFFFFSSLRPICPFRQLERNAHFSPSFPIMVSICGSASDLVPLLWRDSTGCRSLPFLNLPTLSTCHGQGKRRTSFFFPPLLSFSRCASHRFPFSIFFSPLIFFRAERRRQFPSPCCLPFLWRVSSPGDNNMRPASFFSSFFFRSTAVVFLSFFLRDSGGVLLPFLPFLISEL